MKDDTHSVFWLVNLRGRDHLGNLDVGIEYNIKTNLRETACEGVD
jgi:hypothetical protein